MFMFVTSISRGSAPESSIVLKKMGAIFPPTHTPPVRLFGTFGMSSPMNQSTEFVADLRLEPVPTTSPTYASGKPFALSSSICAGASWMPSLGFLSMASAWRGMSGRDHASGAGDRSSVLVSPVTLNTVTVIFSGTGASGEPLGVGPRLHHPRGVLVASLGLGLDVVEGVEHEEGAAELVRGEGSERRVVERLNQGRDVVAALHGAQDPHSLGRVHEGRFRLALHDRREPRRLDVGGLIDARWDPVLEEIHENGLVARGGRLELLAERGDLLRVEGLGRDVLRRALGDVRVVLGEEGGGGSGGSRDGREGRGGEEGSGAGRRGRAEGAARGARAEPRSRPSSSPPRRNL